MDERRDRARAARQALGLTQAELADRIEVRRQTISDYERGVQLVPRGYLSLLAGCFRDYALVFGWLEQGGEVPVLMPEPAPPARSADGGSPGAGHEYEAAYGLWAAITADMAEYERRGQAAPTAQLARWLDRLRTISDAEDAEARDLRRQRIASDEVAGHPPPDGQAAPADPPRGATG